MNIQDLKQHGLAALTAFGVSALALVFLTGPDGAILVMWPGSGLALAMLWLGGLRLAPTIALGLFAATVVTDRLPLAPSLITGSLLEAVVGLYLLRAVGFKVTLQRLRDALALLALVLTVGPILASSITFVSAFLRHDTGSVSDAVHAAVQMWAADALGTLLVAPLILVWAGILARGSRPSRTRITEAAILSAFLVASSLIAFGAFGDVLAQRIYLVIPALFWAALRFGPGGAVLSTTCAQLLLTIFTLHGMGMYVEEAALAASKQQTFGIVCAACVFFLATMASERQHASEEAGRLRAETRFSQLIEHISDIVLIIDHAGQLSYFNAALERVLGYTSDELRTYVPADLVHPEDLVHLRSTLRVDLQRSLEAQTFVLRGRHKDGHWVTLESVATNRMTDPEIRGIVINMRDITERQQAEIELRRAQKLESVGRLAAGVAHELNTPIQFVGDNLHFLRGATSDAFTAVRAVGPLSADMAYLEEEVPLAIDQSLEGIQRVASIVRALKDFASADSRERQPADLNRALRSTLTVAHSQLEPKAMVETDLEALPPVVCHLGDLNQVFLNLLVNAAESIESQGVIRVTSRVDGSDVVISISDTGRGIPEDIRAHVFDPFFTTKAFGQGSGQGLALARAIIVDRHAGSLDFTTSVGEGTTFTIRLPIASAAQLPQAA